MNRTASLGVVLLGGVILLGGVVLLGGVAPLGQETTPAVSWKRASPDRLLTLPADHSSHPDYKLEWWYYTGHLQTVEGRRFGYQLTFFRIGIAPVVSNRSTWAVRDVFLAHAALTDISRRRFRYAERLNRAGPGWAGAAENRYRVWNEDWQASLDAGEHHLQATVRSVGDTFRLDLRLADDRPPVLHGLRGYSPKGTSPGNASHYYSLPRMPTRGTITIDGQSLAVTGTSWMDHEFGTSMLEAQQLGWDWFGLHLDDGRSLMLYRFRRADGRDDSHNQATLVEADGRSRTLSLAGAAIRPERFWHSVASGARYPVAWRLELPREQMTLSVTASVDDQELRATEAAGLTYWEGAANVAGTAAGRPMTGRGYVEMTGYADGAIARYLR
jgi:predicted secreted hydrolase